LPGGLFIFGDLVLENMIALVIGGCVLSAATVFVFMQFRRYDEQQESTVKIRKANTELEACQSKLLGYTKFADYLTAGKQHLSDQAASLNVSVLRDYTYLERFTKDKHKLNADVWVLGRYSVEFSFAADLKADSLELVIEPPGIQIKCGQPVMVGSAVVKNAAHDVSVGEILPDERATFAEVQQKFMNLTHRHGMAVAREDVVRALCKTKMVDCLRDYLVKQPGVKQVPTIVVAFR